MKVTIRAAEQRFSPELRTAAERRVRAACADRGVQLGDYLGGRLAPAGGIVLAWRVEQ